MARAPRTPRALTPAYLATLTPAYAARLQRAEAQGKSRQAARGHVEKREHILRKTRKAAREAAALSPGGKRPAGQGDAAFGGLNNAQKGNVRKFARMQAARDEALDDEDAVADFVAAAVAWATAAGYAQFVAMRTLQAELQAQYVNDREDGVYLMKKGLLQHLIAQFGADETRLLYYH